MFLQTDHNKLFTLSKKVLMPYGNNIYDFLYKWNSKEDHILVSTSGSTDHPKKISLMKKHVVNSANATNKYFDLNSSSTYLICLPTEYIAGKMMIVRALTAKATMVFTPPSINPIQELDQKISFCAMTPYQLIECINSSPEKLDLIEKLIIGGSALSNSIIDKLHNIKTKCFQTFGMTETISHIAIKPLNHSGFTELYECLSHIDISSNDTGQLIINSPLLNIKSLTTNDIVLASGYKRFKWIGRLDNVINSGGIKIHPEMIEKKLEIKLNSDSFFLDKTSHPTLGEQLILIAKDTLDYNTILKAITILDKFEIPKAIYFIDKFYYTPNRKIHRIKTKNSAIKKGEINIPKV